MSLRRLLLALAFLTLTTTPSFATDYFGRSEDTARPVATGTPDSFTLPAPLAESLGAVVSLQSRFNAELRGQLRLAREGQSLRPASMIVLFSFLYGVFHAVGPGHGKLVVGSYFLTRRSRIMHGLAMSASAAMVQAVSAIALVGVLAVLFEMSSKTILAHAATLEIVSYGAISALGLWMLWGVVSGRSCCDHEQKREHVHVHGPHCDHDHDHHHPQPDRPLSEPNELLRVLATGAAVGLRPCSGAILVLLFTLSNDIFLIGVLSTFAMGLGVAITVTVVSLTTLGIHRGLVKLGIENQAIAQRLHRAVALSGALLIILFGMAQLIGIWQGSLTPMAG